MSASVSQETAACLASNGSFAEAHHVMNEQGSDIITSDNTATTTYAHQAPLLVGASEDQEQDQALPSSSSQQAPLPLEQRKKPASLVSRLFSSAAASPMRRNPSSGNSTTSSRTSQSSSSSSPESNSSQRSPQRPEAVVGSVVPPPSLITAVAMPSSKQQSQPSDLKAPPSLKPTSSPDSGSTPPWARLRRQSTAATLISTQSSTQNVDPTAETFRDEEEGGIFETLSLLSPSRSTDTEVTVSDFANMNVLQWLGAACPTDVLPHVLAFLGPQMMARLSKVDRFWFHTVQQEATWKVLCQDMYKWKAGDKEPDSWKQYYCEHPCVPVDYKTVHGALNANTGEHVHVMLRPGRYYLKESVHIDRPPSHKVGLSTMKLPNNIFRAPPATPDEASVLLRKQRKGATILKYLCTKSICNKAAVDEEEASVMSMDQDDDAAALIPQVPTRATLVLRTRRLNEPAIRVQRGHFGAHNINIEHSSHGLDIWNGNAAIQIQPPQPQPQQEGPPVVLRQEDLPVAHLCGMRVSSRTGRGVVTIDGGQLAMKQSRVHECAATGVYIGGRGTRAAVSETDVVRNGLGSRSTRRGGSIARGHSGVYLEQGVADIVDCNVSNNTLTGITAVSTENATLNLRDSDLQGNGSFQLEIPSRNARGINMQQNRLESTGTGRVRAALGN